MSVFAASLNALNLRHADAAELLAHDGRVLKETAIKDWAREKSRVPPGVWDRLQELFELVERAADEIIADQGERDGGECFLPLDLEIAAIDLPHPALREAAAARALLVLGRDLLRFVQPALADHG